MELQFEKTTRNCLQQVLWDTQVREQTQELRLPEGMPDIGQVVSCWAQPVIRGKEWRSDRIGVNGGVMCWVLYTPEEEGVPQAVSAWLPFQMKWDIPQTKHDGTILAQSFVRSADARSLSSRKLMIRTNTGVTVWGTAPGEVTLYMPAELPQDVQLLRRTYPMQIPSEAGEKAFGIEEDIGFPGNLPQPETIVRYELCPVLTEWKLMTDKAVFRGTALLHVLYRGVDGRLCTWDYELPISQYAELDKEYDSDASLEVWPALTDLELDFTEGQMRLKAGLTGQYMVYERPMVELVEDAYSPSRQVVTNMQQLQMPAVLDMNNDTLRVEQSVDMDAGRVIDLGFYPDSPQQNPMGTEIETVFPGVFRLLTEDGEGKLQSTDAYWEEVRTVPAESWVQLQTQVGPGSIPQSQMGGGVLMQADLQSKSRTISNQGIPMVTGMTLGEETQADPNRPSLILRRAGEEDLWDLAKSTGTTVENIRKANRLEEEPLPGQMLIIPVP